jgi:hypothetical protein
MSAAQYSRVELCVMARMFWPAEKGFNERIRRAMMKNQRNNERSDERRKRENDSVLECIIRLIKLREMKSDSDESESRYVSIGNIHLRTSLSPIRRFSLFVLRLSILQSQTTNPSLKYHCESI